MTPHETPTNRRLRDMKFRGGPVGVAWAVVRVSYPAPQASQGSLVSTCRWCKSPLLWDNEGHRIHAINIAYACRDRWGGLLGTYAEPASVMP